MNVEVGVDRKAFGTHMSCSSVSHVHFYMTANFSNYNAISDMHIVLYNSFVNYGLKAIFQGLNVFIDGVPFNLVVTISGGNSRCPPISRFLGSAQLVSLWDGVEQILSKWTL